MKYVAGTGRQSQQKEISRSEINRVRESSMAKKRAKRVTAERAASATAAAAAGGGRQKERVDRDEHEDEVLDEHADGGIENQGREK